MVEDIQKLERVLKALANKRRLSVVQFLRKRKEASVGDIAEYLKLSFKSTSRHLAVLMSADVVVNAQRGLYVYYRINPRMSRGAKSITTLL